MLADVMLDVARFKDETRASHESSLDVMQSQSTSQADILMSTLAAAIASTATLQQDIVSNSRLKAAG
jgi:hypothetical protein